jgi:methionyl-tRNA formyltransferase
MPLKDDKIYNSGEIVAVRDDFIAIRCGNGMLGVTEVQRPGRRAVSARDLSHSLALQGLRLG